MSGPFALAEALGTRIVEVPDLARTLIYVPNHDIALVRAGLDFDSATQAADWLLMESLTATDPTEGGA